MNVDLTQAGYVDSLLKHHLTGAVEREDGRRFVVSLIREKKPILPLGNWPMGEAVIEPNVLRSHADGENSNRANTIRLRSPPLTIDTLEADEVHDFG